ncbi:tetratricopeptide repeat-containing protein [Acanthamoeba castellanii str. Neff]|uniref:Tetratricopeptide repeat-containing protein n=1 Tax=Acanthamoeba castellanii (strain ATCC 30010 / Neff) TaxID=1257118 RepID=L8GEZ4_ACACF|nr:tetratricopeptide repeat-containing protein [Acanthamoeba castellanii str. Neff]ELR11625.1 tetratricopeptide repeat-containing protein [Acanthamoeba castellanii str. Neff]
MQLRFRAVDEEAEPSPYDSSENEEAKCLELYKEALALQSAGDVRASKLHYKQLLRSPFLATTSHGSSANVAALKLRYLCLKNLADVNDAQGNANAALKYYVQALDVESTDVAVWYHVGSLARRTHHTALARHAFERALSCNPKHWLSLEALLEVVFEIGDQAGCRRICKQLLQLDPGHTSALALLGQLASVPDLTCENSLPAELRTKRKWKEVATEEDRGVTARPYDIDALTWEALAGLLLSIYRLASLNGSLSTPVTIVRTARTLDNPTAEPLPQEPTTSAVVSSATDDVKSPPPRKRSRFSTELMGERRQSSRVKDKSKPDAPQQDARLASLASFFRQWSSSAQQSDGGVQEFRKVAATDVFPPARAAETRYESQDVRSSLERRRGEEADAVIEFIRRYASVGGGNNRGIMELMRACLVWACLDLPDTVPWNALIKERLVALHQGVISHSTTPHPSWVPAAEIAFDLARGDQSAASSRFLATCQTTTDHLFMDQPFLDSLDARLLTRLFWLRARASAMRGDAQATTMNLQACRTHYAEAVLASSGGGRGGERHIVVAYLAEGSVIDEETISRVEESIRSKVDKAHVSSAFHARNYQEVVRVLGPRLMAAPAPKPNNAAMPRQERIYLLGLLAEAYRGCGNPHQALLCGQTLLHETVADLSNPLADTRQATLSLLATVRSVPPGTTWLTPLIPDLKELLRTTALQAAAHPNRELGRGVTALALSTYLCLLEHESGSASNHHHHLVDYVAAAHSQLAQLGACRHEDGAFLRLAIPHLSHVLSREESDRATEPRTKSTEEGREEEETRKASEDEEKGKEDGSESEEMKEDDDDDIEEVEERVEEQLLQCLYCLYNVQLCDARKLDSHPGRGGLFSPETPAQAAALLRAIHPFIRRPARLPAALKASAFDALQQVLHHFPLPPASLYKDGKRWVMAVVNGEPEASAEARPPTYGTAAAVEGDFHQVYENLYFLLAKCMTKREQQQQQQQEAADSASRERSKDKQLQTAWLYKQDLFVNPSRASSWAALGKHYAQELEQLLDAALPWQPCQDAQLRTRVAKYFGRAERCLEQAVKLEPERTGALECLGELILNAVRFRRALPAWSAHKRDFCQRAHSAYERLQRLGPSWRYLYWMAKLERKMGAPVGNYLAQFNGALCLVRTESKRGNNKSECRQHEAEVLYQLHGSRLKELFSPSPDSKGAKKGGKAEEEGEAADTSAEAAQTGQERRTFLLHDAMSALARPHQVYVYFHKSVYRLAWALRESGRVEEAKALLGSIFSDKKLSKQLIQVWRVDLDGPGKFEAYRRKYLLLFNELLRDTRDVDRLELLVLKLFKDPILSQQRDVLVASCSSLVQALAERIREKWSSHEDNPQPLLPPTATTPIDLTYDSPPLSLSQDEVKTWLRRSYDAYLHALSAFARPGGLPREEGAADQEAEQKLGVDRMLVRSFQLYRLAHSHTIPGDADGWSASQVASFCQKAFKTRPPRKVGAEDEEARDYSNRQRADPSDHQQHQRQDYHLLDESLDVSQGPPLLVPPTPDLPRPADLRKKAARRPKPTFPDLPPLSPFRAPPAASSSTSAATTDS